MKKMFNSIWSYDKKGFLRILFIDIVSSLTVGISIGMLVPILSLTEMVPGNAGKFAFIVEILQGFPYKTVIIAIAVAYFFMVVFKALLNRAASFCSTQFVEGYSRNLRSDLYEAVGEASWESLNSYRHTALMDLFLSRCSQVSYSLSEIIRLISMALTATAQLAVAFILSAPLTLAVIIAGCCAMFIFRPFIKKSRSGGTEMMEAWQEYYNELNNQLGGIKEIRSYSIQKYQKSLFKASSDRYYAANMRMEKLQSVPNMLYTIGAGFLIGGILVLSVAILKVPPANLLVIVLIFSNLWPLFASTQNRLQNIASALPAFEALNKTINDLSGNKESSPEEEATDTFDFDESIIFEHVNFTYQDGEEACLKDVSFRIDSNTMTALVGSSGAGKSTLADLLLGLLKCQEGHILIDGIPLTPQNIIAWRKLVSYIPQDPLVIDATIRENLLRFHPGAREEEMFAALDKAQALELVKKLPLGLDTVLGERGFRLSGGERQRIVLARALMGKPKLIIMDEATSALDHETEYAIKEVINSLKGQVTLIVIAHRFTTIKDADKIVVVEDGEIREEGSFTQLKNKPGSYVGQMSAIY